MKKIYRLPSRNIFHHLGLMVLKSMPPRLAIPERVISDSFRLRSDWRFVMNGFVWHRNIASNYLSSHHQKAIFGMESDFIWFWCFDQSARCRFSFGGTGRG
ncbi:MAG: hypothetical protein WDM76_11915 [Limisphaerales bacterium]